MREHRVRRLPVVDRGGSLVGIISVDDLAREALRKASVLDSRAVLETIVATSHYKQLERGSAS
jgi:CBS domain-containing protein